MSKDKQIIVETHSDHLLNRVRRRVAESQTNTEGSVGIYFAQREEGLTEFRLAELDSNGRYKMTDFPKGFFLLARWRARNHIFRVVQADRVLTWRVRRAAVRSRL